MSGLGLKRTLWNTLKGPEIKLDAKIELMSRNGRQRKV